MPAGANPLPCIRVFATGGTIAGAQIGGARGYKAAALSTAAFSTEALIAAVPQLSALAHLKVEQVTVIGRQDIDDATWLKLASRTQAALDDSAVAVAACAETRRRGVLVVANDEHPFAREVAKTNTTQVRTFRATHRGLAGGGDSNLGATALAPAAPAAKTGIAVVRSSRMGGGVVERNIEVDDDALGFIAADELNPPKARVLLMLGLTRIQDPRALQEMFFAY